MKSLNQLVIDYNYCLQRGEVQVAYKGILDFISKLRADFINKYPNYDVGSIYQGYMDMSYFSLGTKFLKDKGMKIAVVYLHEKGRFEVWLSARNREISKTKEHFVNNINFDNLKVFHDDNNHDAIIECILISTPDFDNQAELIYVIEQGVSKFVTAVQSAL